MRIAGSSSTTRIFAARVMKVARARTDGVPPARSLSTKWAGGKPGKSPVPPTEMLDVGELGIPSHFPQEAIRVGEVARVTAPFGVLWGLYDAPTQGSDLFEKQVHFHFR